MEIRTLKGHLALVLILNAAIGRCASFGSSVSFYKKHILSSAYGNESNGKAVDCSAVRNFNASLQCKFVLENEDCQTENGFLEYNEVIYCHLANTHTVAFIILAFWLIYLFIALGITAEDFFCPCLKTFAKCLRMSDSVAGVTLLALGNGAPDIFSVLVAITSGNQNAAPLAFQELYGSGMFVTTVVVGSIQLRNSFKLARRPFIRDVIFYISAVGWTFAVMYRKDIQIAEAVGFIILYIIYVTLVIAGQAVNRTIRSNKIQQDDDDDDDEPNGPKHYGDIQQPPQHACNPVFEDLNASADFTEFEPNERLIKNSHQRAKSFLSRIREMERDENNVSVEISFSDRSFLEILTGISVKEWKIKGWFWKLFDIIKVPLNIVLNLTIPVIDVDDDDLRWNKWLVAVQCFASPAACAFITKKAFIVVYKDIVLWELLLILGVLLSMAVLIATSRTRPPRFSVIFAIAGFAASVIWIYAFAQEIVNLLMAFGISFGLTNAVLGLTLLAWANSIGDFISNMAMAKNGAPRMAIAACYGGPLLNMLLGVGISCTVSAITHNGYVALIRGNTQYIISAVFLAASLVFALFLMPLLKFVTSRTVGAFLILLYIAYLSLSVVNELKLLPQIEH